MFVLTIYIFVVAALATFLLIRSYLAMALKFLLHPSGCVHDFLSKHILLPYLLRRRKFLGPITRLRAIFQAIHFAGTISCNVIGVHNLTAARSRAGSLAILHIASLAVFPHMGIGSAFLNMSRKTYHELHITLGTMAILQSLLHVGFALQVTPFDLSMETQRWGFSVSILGHCIALLMYF